MALTPLAIAALALLSEKPMHPYEMYQLMLERREDRVVKIRPGSLYHTVERLHADKMVEVTGTEREGNRPERTTYAITAEGQTALVSRIRELIQRPVQEYPQFVLAISEAHTLEPEQAAADLTQYVAALDADVDELSAGLDAALGRGVPEAYLIDSAYALTTARAQRDWIRTLITRIETKDLTWQPHQL